jgi:hypothetical protein
VVVEQPHGRRERNEVERQYRIPTLSAHGKKRKEEQDEDDRIQYLPF